jgi:hypothetical protein
VLVDAECCDATVRPENLDWNYFVDERAVVDRSDGTLMRAQGPGIHVLARDADGPRGVPPHRDRHVTIGRLGRIWM